MGARRFFSRLLKPFGLVVHRRNSANKHYFIEAYSDFKKGLITELAQRFDYTIRRGPFSGMRLPHGGSWSDYDLGSKIIGSYESELFSSLEDAINWRPEAIVNIGASEGYYAVGLSRRIKTASVFAYDTDLESRHTLATCAKINNSDVQIIESLDLSDANSYFYREIEKFSKILFVVDCEGCEIGLKNVPSNISVKSAFIIEIHKKARPDMSSKLKDFLKESHTLVEIHQETKKVEDYDELDEFMPLLGAVVLDEFREYRMSWLVAWPK
ncbi:hypothetical protein [Thioclava sp. F28-4]|uniref:hypothetical protein n=1 Tax=Thioclava sp. F28-4 TaxID=1915315 RepID=UPI0011BAD9FB|nr:hypothetical protein [Thioclava sp. F28-4]